MKPRSERTLILAGSLFLAGLIIADVLTQHLNQLESTREENLSSLTIPSGLKRGSQSIEPMPQDENSNTGKPTKNSKKIIEVDTPGKSASTKKEPTESKEFTAELTPPPPVQSSEPANENELPFERAGILGKYHYVTAEIPQTQFNVFYNVLNPHGRWFRHSNFGTCWIPQESQKNPQWRPYVNAGKWTYTKNGWLWHSNYRWGGYPFHFGRWFHTSKGWAWKPEGNWSTAWVSWRNAGEHCGWAPLPPIQTKNQSSKSNRASKQLKTASAVNAASLGEDHYVFLKKQNLLETSLQSKILEAEKARSVFRQSKPADRFVRGSNQRIGNHGIPANNILPWIQKAQKNQTASQKVSANKMTPRDSQSSTTVNANRNRNVYPNRLVTQPLNNAVQGEVSQSIPNKNGIPGTQVAPNNHLTRQDQFRNIRQAEQRMTHPAAPGKVHSPYQKPQAR